jgi:S-methylmethionine-dependent homocysteine/selenocysteine methylase
VSDGGTGTTLIKQGLPRFPFLWSALSVTLPQYHSLLRKVHLDFMVAGSRIIIASNYSITPVNFSPEEIERYTREACRLALEARDEYYKSLPDGEKRSVRVFGSMPPLNESYRPDLVPRDDDSNKKAFRTYCMIAQVFIDYSMDGIIVETMSSIHEMSLTIEALNSRDSDKLPPVILSWSLNTDGLLHSKESPSNAIMSALAARKVHLRVEAIAFNCCLPEAVTIALQQLDSKLLSELRDGSIGLGAYPNMLVPVSDNWDNHHPIPSRKDLSPDSLWNDYVHIWIKKYGITHVGGCCGVLPNFIERIRQGVDSLGEGGPLC